MQSPEITSINGNIIIEVRSAENAACITHRDSVHYREIELMDDGVSLSSLYRTIEHDARGTSLMLIYGSLPLQIATSDSCRQRGTCASPDAPKWLREGFPLPRIERRGKKPSPDDSHSMPVIDSSLMPSSASHFEFQWSYVISAIDTRENGWSPHFIAYLFLASIGAAKIIELPLAKRMSLYSRLSGGSCDERGWIGLNGILLEQSTKRNALVRYVADTAHHLRTASPHITREVIRDAITMFEGDPVAVITSFAHGCAWPTLDAVVDRAKTLERDFSHVSLDDAVREVRCILRIPLRRDRGVIDAKSVHHNTSMQLLSRLERAVLPEIEDAHFTLRSLGVHDALFAKICEKVREHDGCRLDAKKVSGPYGALLDGDPSFTFGEFRDLVARLRIR